MLSKIEKKNLEEKINFLYFIEMQTIVERKLKSILIRRHKNHADRIEYVTSLCEKYPKVHKIWQSLLCNKDEREKKRKSFLIYRIGKYNSEYIEKLGDRLKLENLFLDPSISYFKNSYFTLNENLIDQEKEEKLKSMGFKRVFIRNKKGWGEA